MKTVAYLISSISCLCLIPTVGMADKLTSDQLSAMNNAGDGIADCASYCSEQCFTEVGRIARRIETYLRSCVPPEDSTAQGQGTTQAPSRAVGAFDDYTPPFKCTYAVSFFSPSIGTMDRPPVDATAPTVALALTEGCNKCKPYTASGYGGKALFSQSNACKFAACVDANGEVIPREKVQNLIPSRCL